jgi:ribosomal protein S18 acetylase RimI-like enzyme
MRVERANNLEAVMAAAPLFDAEPTAAWTERFLRATGHELLLAYEEDEPVGFVTGVELTHPDKGTEMFLYELGVAEAYRRRGIGSALVEALAALARERGCTGLWVLTEPDNEPALRTYQSLAGGSPETAALVAWRFDSSP